MNQKPVLLLADSQLLFWRKNSESFLKNYLAGQTIIKAAYIGIANEDLPEFYQIFISAMQVFEAIEVRQITRNLTAADEQFLQTSDIILLAGGDVLKGWQIFEQTGLSKIIIERFYEGAHLIGVSAGAIHLGLFFLDQSDQLHTMLKCLPLIIDVHQDDNHWMRLKKILEKVNNPYIYGLGIPLGSGIIYHPDHSLEVLNKTAWLFDQKDGHIKSHLLFPGDFKFQIKETHNE